MSGRGESLPLLELPRQALDVLGGGGGLEALTRLRPARRSRNLLLLRGLRERARAVEPTGRAGQVMAHLDAGLDLLRAVQQHAPTVFDEVMDDPMTGAWLGCWVQGAPLAETAAEAASLAASAAHRAGLRFRIAVPLRSGAVMLPGLGLALLPGAAGAAEVVGGGGRCRVDGPAGGSVRVPAAGEECGAGYDRPDWHGLRRLRCVADGRSWTFFLDSLNPFRVGRDPVAPRPMDAGEAAWWEAELGSAWRLLVRRHPDRAAEVGQLVSSVVPLRWESPAVDERGGWLSATFGDAVGLVALARHPGTRSLAAGLVHEVQHSKLCALLDVVDLLEFPPETRCYSPWREDPRPPSALLQGAYAFMAVAGFWRDEAASSVGSAVAASLETVPETSPGTSPGTGFAHWYRQTRSAVAELSASDWPTEDGRRFLSAMRRTLDAWADTTPAPQDVSRMTAGAAEHRVRWRLRHLPQPRRAVELLVAARSAGGAAPVAASWLLRAPGTLPPDRWEIPAGAAPPGTARAAAELEALLCAPDAGGPEQWARLASLALLLADHRATALAAMPELVRAVHTALAHPEPGNPGPAWSPLDLAHWLRPVMEAYPAGGAG